MWKDNCLNANTDSDMKRILFLIFICLFISCTAEKKSYSHLRNNELSVTRRYIGNFLDYSHTGPEVFGGFILSGSGQLSLTHMGKFRHMVKTANSIPGDKIYLKRMYSTPGPYGNWEYQIENDSSVVYRMSNYRYENNVLVQAIVLRRIREVIAIL